MKTPEKIQQLTALQRIQVLEGALGQTIDAAQMLVKENATLKAQVLELSAQIQAIIEIQDIQEAVGKNIVKQNIADLEGRIARLLESKEIAPSESVGPKSFVVAKEFNKEGNETNPRIQFSMDQVSDEDLKLALIGKVVGDNVEYKNSNVQIIEIYHSTME